MTTTTYNSKDVKYIWNTSDDDCLTSMVSIFEDNIIYVIMCAYNDDTADMEYTYYKSTDTVNNKVVWNQLMVDDLENFDKYFKEVTDEEDIEYMKAKRNIYNIFVYDTRHYLDHDVLRSMIIALYTNITNETSIPDDVLNLIYADVIDMLLGVNTPPLSEDALDYIRKYANDSPFDHPILSYRETQYRNLVLNVIELIKNIYVQL
jgi:hypothetical protein